MNRISKPHALITIIEGEKAGESFEINENGISIGRDSQNSQNDVALQANIISREHAVIRYHSETDSFTLLDRGSRNGTWQNRVEIIGEVKLEDGDEIVIGSSVFEFKSLDVTPKSSPLMKNRFNIILLTLIFFLIPSASLFIFRFTKSMRSISTKTPESKKVVQKVILTKVAGDSLYETEGGDSVELGTSRMLIAGAVDEKEHRPIACKINFKIVKGFGVLTNLQKSLEGTSLTETTDEKSGLARIFLITKENPNNGYNSKGYLVEISASNQIGVVEPFHVLCVDKKSYLSDDLLKFAKLESDRAERFERDGKLYESIRSWERAIEIMFPLYFNFPIYRQTITRYDRTKSRFNRTLQDEYSLARIAFEQGNIKDSLRHLEEIKECLPNKNDPRYLKAEERALGIYKGIGSRERGDKDD